LGSLKVEKYMIMINFFVMIVGILIGFYLEGIRKQHELNKITKTKLHMMYLESQYTIKVGKELFDCYSNTNTIQINLKRLDVRAANSVLEDDNKFRLLEPHKITLIRAYVEAAQIVDEYNERYNDYISTINYQITETGKKYREKIMDLSASFMATCYLVQQEFLEYFNEDIYNQSQIEDIESTIQEAKQKVLTGKFTIREN